MTNTPKRRRLNIDFMEMKKAGSSELTVIAEEARKMQAMTISFGVPDRGKSKTGVGYVFVFTAPLLLFAGLIYMCRFKYDAQVVQCALFPHLYQGSIVNPPPAKRRKIAVTRENQADGNAEMDSVEDPRRGIVLESSKETYLIAWYEGKARYTLSVLGPRECLVDTPSRKASPPDSLIPLAEAASKMQDTPKISLRGPSEERRMSTDDPLPLSGVTSDPPESGTSPDPKAENNETEAPSKPPSKLCPLVSPTSSARVLRSNLSDDDFSFENDMIIIKGTQHQMDDRKMDVDGEGQDAVKMRVLRWRWNLKP